MSEVEALIKQYQLIPHPEGGYFKAIWESDIQANVTDKGYDGPRLACSSIYYLVNKPAIMKWHRLISPELYFWHAGGTLQLHFIDKDGKYFVKLLGDTVKNNNCIYQVIIEAHTWMAGEVVEDGDYTLWSNVVVPESHTWMAGEVMEDEDYTLWSNVVVPGFDYKDWELGELDKMVKDYPRYKSEIERLFINTNQEQQTCS
ncbi:hypothetical protein KUTeg_021891 [Tegillarca granosa]|uniref:DUF985 domain-containing protein n=1 Tax=Tegillarca granosa TaxID=220873 RepID=A0ABQ9EA03_TEGGR|nr:hypothetical protein KUTeg_021891 [Tegillarca granosa]